MRTSLVSTTLLAVLSVALASPLPQDTADQTTRQSNTSSLVGGSLSSGDDASGVTATISYQTSKPSPTRLTIVTPAAGGQAGGCWTGRVHSSVVDEGQYQNFLTSDLPGIMDVNTPGFWDVGQEHAWDNKGGSIPHASGASVLELVPTNNETARVGYVDFSSLTIQSETFAPADFIKAAQDILKLCSPDGLGGTIVVESHLNWAVNVYVA